MHDDEFIEHLEKTGRITWYLFGCTGMWRINSTCLALFYKQQFKEEKCCFSSENSWHIKTTRYFIILRTGEFGRPLEDFWKHLDFEALESEAKILDERFSRTQDC